MNSRALFPGVAKVLVKFLCLQKVLFLVQGQESTTTTTSKSTKTLKTFQIYHSLAPDEEFTPRGSIQFSTSDEDSDKEIKVSTTTGEDCFSNAFTTAFQDLMATNGLYRVKVVDEDSGHSVLASASACDVRRSNWREEIGLSLGDSGSLISISYKPIVSPLALPCKELPPLVNKEGGNNDVSSLEFKTKISYSTSSQGMTIPVVMPQNRPPPGYAWIKRLVKRGENPMGGLNGGKDGSSNTGSSSSNTALPFDPTENDKKNEQQSFFRRYWYIILPITIMTLLGGEEDPNNVPQRAGAVPSAGGGNAAAGMTAAAAAGGAAASRGGGQARQRRGKRG